MGDSSLKSQVVPGKLLTPRHPPYCSTFGFEYPVDRARIRLRQSRLYRVIIQIMKSVRRGQQNPQDSAIRQPLLEFRHALLDLHKALIDSERTVYEANVGPVQSPHHFFKLLTNDPWFAWLRPISQLIVVIDEVLDAREPLTNDNIDAIIMESVFLLVPVKGEREFSERYLAALQRDPAVVLAHAQVVKRIPPGKSRA